MIASSSSGFIGVLQGLSIAAGLIQMALVLGYGMVKIPIKLWTSSSPADRLGLAKFMIAKYDKKNR